MIRICVILSFFLVNPACPLVRAYEINPVSKRWSGQTSGGSISQVVTCNFDEPVYCELFVGESDEVSYRADVYSYPAGVVALATGVNINPKPYTWLRFDLNAVFADSFVKGRRYEFRFTRDDESINYYYQDNNPYPEFGWMKAGSDSTPLKGLACRIYGRMDAVDPRWWGANANLEGLARCGRDTQAIREAVVVGLRWVRDDFASWYELTKDTSHVKETWQKYSNSGLDILGILCYGSHDPAITTRPQDSSVLPEDSGFYPPRNLFADVTSDSNHWARYVQAAMEVLSDVKYWQVWNEPNVSFIYFGNPDPRFYKGDIAGPLGGRCVDTPRERCSLYVRMCRVAKRIADSLAGVDGVERRIVAGCVSGLTTTSRDVGLSQGVEWLGDMLEISGREYGDSDSCFGVISVHPYQSYGRVFDARKFQDDLDTAWAVIQAKSDKDRELWVTEIGWGLYQWSESLQQYKDIRGATPELVANNLCKFYTSSIGSQLDPQGRYDRVFWYELTDRRGVDLRNGGFGLLDSSPGQRRKPASYALEQLIDRLVGRRLNRRLVPDDTRDDEVQVYEFEDTKGRRFWVCWSNDTGSSTDVEIPVRTDELAAESLAYDVEASAFEAKPDLDGWLSLGLNERPVFVWETGPAERPDLVVDSVKVAPEEPEVGKVMMVRAWVRNTGSRATPEGLGTKVDYYLEGDLFGSDQSIQAIRAGETRCFESGWTEVLPDMRGPGLFSAKVNPCQRFVELDVDDNAGYARAEVLQLSEP